MTHDPKKHVRLTGFLIEVVSLFFLGCLVAALFFILHHLELFKAIDRTVTDGLMRAIAWNDPCLSGSLPIT